MKKHLARLGPKLPRYYAQIMSVILLVLILAVPAMATDSTTGTSVARPSNRGRMYARKAPIPLMIAHAIQILLSQSQA